jgi:hypothetical protein
VTLSTLKIGEMSRVDLFATRAILPSLARAYKVMPAMVILR